MANMSPDQMMDIVELLDDQVDDITEALAPLLKSSLQDTAAKLPVVDKARLYVLTTYAIDSLLFSYLRLNGINAREHPVMRELERVKQYVKKINDAQSGKTEAKRETTLNKEVAARFVKHDLAGNDKWDREHAAEKAKEKAAAHAKFEELSRKIESREAENPSNKEAQEEDGSSESDEENPKDKYEHEEILTINDTEDVPGDKKMKNEEQVNRILNTFKNHGVPVSPSGKRKFDGDTTGGGTEDARREKKNASKKKRRQERKEAEKANRLSNNGEEETLPKKDKRKHFRRRD